MKRDYINIVVYFDIMFLGKSCWDIKIVLLYVLNGMYCIYFDGGYSFIWVYCDMMLFGGGWMMCYLINNSVNFKKEVIYNECWLYGINGYRINCNYI